MIGLRSKQALGGAGIGLVLLSNIFLFLPFTLYVGNYRELTTSFASITFTYLTPVLFILGLVAVIAMLLPRSLYLLFASLLAGLSILLWFQGNMLVWEYGLMDGRAIDWSANLLKGWVEISIWLIILIFIFFTYKRFSHNIIGFAVTIFLLQFTLFIYNLATNKSDTTLQLDQEKIAKAESNIYRYSSKDNIVHIIADGFQSDIFTELTSTGELGKVASNTLSGFTYFPNNLGAYPYTHMTVPAILTGKLYLNHTPIQEHLAATVGSESILSVAQEHGYEIDMAIGRGVLMDIYSRAPHNNLHALHNKSHVSVEEFELYDATKLFDLALFRASPHFIKKHIYNDQIWFTQSILTNQSYKSLRNFSDNAFLRRSATKLTADREQPVYKLFHLMMSHNPMVTDSSCSYSGRVLETNRKNVLYQAGCGLLELVNFFESMKKAGIYDSATIVLMGDHGAWVQPRGMLGKDNPDGKNIEFIQPNVAALATPLLAIKPPGATGQLKANNAPSWIVDTAATIADIKDMKASFPGKSILNLDPEKPRDRRFMFYAYGRSEWTDNYLEPIEEFKLDGDPVNSKSWQHINTHLPEGEAEHPLLKSSVWHSMPRP